MNSKILFLSINAHHHLVVCSTGHSRLQNGCLLHYHTADGVLTSGCSFISQHIWIKICIVLAILGICVMSKTFSATLRSMWIHISGRQIDDLGTLGSGIVTGWCRSGSGQRWHQLWSWLSALVGWRCTCSFASPAVLRIVCSATLARKASVPVVLMMHCRVSFYRSFHHLMPRKLNSLQLLFSDFSVRLLDQILRFLFCGMRKPSFCYFGHSEGQAHVGLFQLYPASFHYHSSRHYEKLQEICCCC